MKRKILKEKMSKEQEQLTWDSERVLERKQTLVELLEQVIELKKVAPEKRWSEITPVVAKIEACADDIEETDSKTKARTDTAFEGFLVKDQRVARKVLRAVVDNRKLYKDIMTTIMMLPRLCPDAASAANTIKATISASVDQLILEKTDDFAKKLNKNRSQVIEMALKLLLEANGYRFPKQKQKKLIDDNKQHRNPQKGQLINLSAERPWEKLGISRRTFYRKIKKEGV